MDYNKYAGISSSDCTSFLSIVDFDEPLDKAIESVDSVLDMLGRLTAVTTVSDVKEN